MQSSRTIGDEDDVKSTPEETDSIFEDDAENVSAPFTYDRYTRYQLYRIIHTWLKTNQIKLGFTLDGILPQSEFYPRPFAWMLRVKNKKIGVFFHADLPIVTATGYTRPSPNPSLHEVLKAYKKHGYECDKLLIPVVGEPRDHVRLLVIEPNKRALYYDSKFILVSIVSDIAASIWVTPASDIAGLQKKYEYYKAVRKNYDYLRTVLAKHFPTLSITSMGFGHQAIMNNIDCGPLTFEYLKCEISGISPFWQRIDIDQARNSQEELFQAFDPDFNPPPVQVSLPPVVKKKSYVDLTIFNPADSQKDAHEKTDECSNDHASHCKKALPAITL